MEPYKKITTAIEGKEGEYRKFSFSDKLYEIKEVIDNPQVSMMWRWTTGVCPYCKRKIERIVRHDFYRIEVLVPEDVKNPTLKDIILIGDTLDRRKMFIPIDSDAFKQALLKSKKFRKLLREVL